MYNARGIESIATVTELRQNTSELVETAKSSGRGVLVQSNNQPMAIVMSPERYYEMRDREQAYLEGQMRDDQVGLQATQQPSKNPRSRRRAARAVKG